MSMKRLAYLPLSTYPEPAADQSVVAALTLAGALGADLHATTFAVDIPRVTTPIGGLLINIPEMIGAAEGKSRAHCDRLGKFVAQEAASLSVATTHGTKIVAPGLVGEEAATEARYFDLTLLPWSRDDPAGQELAQSVLFGSGRPAILLPENSAPGAARHYAVAWDGSRVAARALSDALQIMAPDSQVTVITVKDEKSLAGEDIARACAATLERRGLKARATSATLDRRTIGDALQETAKEAGAEILVMGGYGHSRIRDFVLGGATRNVFANLHMPVLLSH